MAQMVVRNLEDDVKRQLQERARRNGRSTEAEVREILRAAVGKGLSEPRPFGSSVAARFERIGLTAPIPELRGEPARPARFAGEVGDRRDAKGARVGKP